MDKTRKIILIAGGILIAIFFVSLSSLFYIQKEKAKNELVKTNQLLRNSEQNVDTLQKENNALEQEIAKNLETINNVLKEKDGLADQLKKETEKLDEESKTVDSLKSKLELKNNEIARLRDQIASLKNELENNKKPNDPINDSQRGDNNGSSKKFKREDFVAYYTGKEAFLTNCTSSLCKAINLNNEGIKYAVDGEAEKAASSFKEALEIDSSYSPARINLDLIQNIPQTK
jgi:DNA repair exonuclease SbcCD ATPase subunit